jgi:Ca2+-binding RTX toxin-like protein
MSANQDVASFSVGRSRFGDSDQIVLRDGSGVNRSCGTFRNPHTLENTEQVTVNVTAFGKQTVVINDPGAFVDPTGVDEGQGVDETEFNIALGDSNTDVLQLVGGSSADRFRYGSTGINPNPVEPFPQDADIVHSGVEGHVAEGGLGSDGISGAGFVGTGEPFPSRIGISGGGDPDSLTGGAGPDRLSGDAGNDNLDGGFGADLLAGGDDFDTVNYVLRSEAVDVTISQEGSFSFVSGSANDESGGLRDAVAADVEAVRGGGGDDRLTGNENTNSLHGGSGGLDELRGLGGADTLSGDVGEDTLAGGVGGDELLGGDGRDALAGNDGGDELFGDAGNDDLNGNRGSDSCRGGTGNGDTARSCESITGVP